MNSQLFIGSNYVKNDRFTIMYLLNLATKEDVTFLGSTNEKCKRIASDHIMPTRKFNKRECLYMSFLLHNHLLNSFDYIKIQQKHYVYKQEM